MTPAALRCLRAELAQAAHATWTGRPGIESEDWETADAVLVVLQNRGIIKPEPQP